MLCFRLFFIFHIQEVISCLRRSSISEPKEVENGLVVNENETVVNETESDVNKPDEVLVEADMHEDELMANMAKEIEDESVVNEAGKFTFSNS